MVCLATLPHAPMALAGRPKPPLKVARRQVASLIHADPREIVWTSGATESDNLAIKGAVTGKNNPHIVTSMIEHKAVLDTCKWLEGQGVEVTWLKPGRGRAGVLSTG